MRISPERFIVHFRAIKWALNFQAFLTFYAIFDISLSLSLFIYLSLLFIYLFLTSIL